MKVFARFREEDNLTGLRFSGLDLVSRLVIFQMKNCATLLVDCSFFVLCMSKNSFQLLSFMN